jgi:hypothetical protein
MEVHHHRRLGKQSDPWLLIRISILNHLGMPQDARFEVISDRKLSGVMKQVVNRVRFPNDEAIAKLLIMSFIKIPGTATPSYPRPPLPRGPSGSAAVLSARSAYGEKA